MAIATPDPAEDGIVGWRVRVIEWATDETVRVTACKSERVADRISRGMEINMSDDFYTEVADSPRTTTPSEGL